MTAFVVMVAMLVVIGLVLVFLNWQRGPASGARSAPRVTTPQ
jgi:hypothetical protein